MNKSLASTSWSLRTDHVHAYSWVNDVFTPSECQQIIEHAKTFNMQYGSISDPHNKNQDKSIRDSKVVFLAPSDDMNWVYSRLTDAVNYTNDLYYKFELYGFGEHLQFTEYSAPMGHYDYHIDKMTNSLIRKLSIVLQLTDDALYEGGDLQILNSDIPESLIRKQGTMLAFPSYTLHRVTPVTKGTRNSLVAWINGPCFR